jgi:FdhE protein
VTLDSWLRSHPYLQSVAQLYAQVDAATGAISPLECSALGWEHYADDFLGGVPLFRSSAVVIDYSPVEKIIPSLLNRLVSSSLPTNLIEELGSLRRELLSDPAAARHLMAGLLDHNSCPRSNSGLERYLGWTALARYLRPLIETFGTWRDEERWLRNYCPTCGSLPAMAQLVGVDQGRQRFHCCGCCRTRWLYLRTGCPFCGNADDHRLAALTVEGEGGLRIDYCESCRGYLKTYAGEGSEGILLADWTSIHLDVIACDRGLKRLAASLYEL